MTEARVVIVCEGRTDSAFYEAVLEKAFALRPERERNPVWGFFRRGQKAVPFRFLQRADLEVVVVAAGSAEQVFTRFKEYVKLAASRADHPLAVTNWLLCIDLDNKSDSFFQDKIEELSQFLSSLGLSGAKINEDKNVFSVVLKSATCRLGACVQPHGLRGFRVGAFQTDPHTIDELLLDLDFGVVAAHESLLESLIRAAPESEGAREGLPTNHPKFIASLLSAFVVPGSGLDALAMKVVGRASDATLSAMLSKVGLLSRLQLLDVAPPSP